MLTEVSKHIKFIFLNTKYNLSREMENRGAFIFKAIGMLINNFLMIIQWVVIFSIKTDMGGLEFNDVLYVWALSSGAFGFSHLLFYNSILLGEYISEGKLDAYLVQPKNALVNFASSRMNTAAIGDIVYAYLIICFTGFDIVKLLCITFFIVSGGLILTAFYIITGSFSFFMGNSQDFSSALNGIMLNFSTYAEKFFEGHIKWLLFTVVPVGYLSFLPARVLKEFNLPVFLGVGASSIIICLIAFGIFFKGLKRYSSGNLMQARY